MASPPGWNERRDGKLLIRPTGKPYRLNLGSGFDRSVTEAINVDINLAARPDVVADLNKFPYPFRDSVFDEVWCKDVIEHLDRLTVVMEDIHRISKAGAKVVITVPHFSCANTFIDVTHTRSLSFFSFDYFTENSPYSYYSKARFKILHRYIFFHNSPWDLAVQVFANRFPKLYEHRLAWIFPAWFLYFELEVCK